MTKPKKYNYYVKKIYNPICPNCEKKFIAHRKDKEFCTTKCYNAYYRKNPNHREAILKSQKKCRDKNKEKYNANRRNNQAKYSKRKYKYLKRIYEECELGINNNRTTTHKVFSFLNSHPDTKYWELFLKFPTLGEMQLNIYFYYWHKITKEKYEIKIDPLLAKIVNGPSTN